MQFLSYWHETAPAFASGAQGPVQGHYDVAIVGAGFTGLGAARKLAMEGRSVVVLEARSVGFGASGRNGGHLNNGVSHSYLGVRDRFGREKAKSIYRAYDQAIETVERVIADEGISCDFRRSGKLKLASKPAHYDNLARIGAALREDVDQDVEMLSKADLAREVVSEAYHGGLLQKKSAMMHMGRYVTGLGEAAARRGAVVFENTAVTSREAHGKGWKLNTARGHVTADKVLLATGAYTDGAFPWFRRRIVPVGSFIIATRPLTDAEIASTVPGNRTYVNSRNIGNYYRLSPDNRLIFGGRARFSGRSDQQSDAKSGKILRGALAEVFPHLADVQIDYCWGGLVDMTADRYPRAGEADGLYFSMGYSGHGAQLATHMGEIMADLITGRINRNPWDGLPWQAVPFHTGKPWFLPLVGQYYKFLDLIR
ncbi:FAD-binding oxidoreductase [Paracoccus sp. IB05]|uniref:NAD(P)/FAD-dependent oxidoreductase n=1 Tax=Paracoccus sp. IB05 TaxID=2779367 RepID=UPI0018E833E2|nr:FAD-binding oxidoreductase [Paracoccus sp. IB05]MBJ2152854.1 FAD-binding oxidoreductase [Paracoccus sp. IB05]